MATVSQSGVYNLQSLTSVGALGVGMRLYTYTAGTTTHKTAYTDSAGAVAHTYTSDGSGGQYIAMDARGELPAPLYLTSGAYDLALKTAAGATVWTRRADPFGANLAEGTGASLVGFIQSGARAVATTVQAKLRESKSVEDYGAVGDGVTDDTIAIQAALDAASGSVELHFLGKTYITDPLTVPSNIVIHLHPSTIIKAKSGYGANDPVLYIASVDNVTIHGNGGKVLMRKADYPTSDQRHGVLLISATNVRIYDLRSDDAGGDGFYVGANSGSGLWSENILLQNCYANNNNRQGLSITSARDMWVIGGEYSGTNGTAPEAGIDVEPNDGFIIQNVNIVNVKTSSNKGSGILVVPKGSGSVAGSYFSLNISGHESYNDVTVGGTTPEAALRFDNGAAPSNQINGIISVSNCRSYLCNSSGLSIGNYAWSNSPELVFDNVKITNPGTTATASTRSACGVSIGSSSATAISDNIKMNNVYCEDLRGTKLMYAPFYISSGAQIVTNLTMVDCDGVGYLLSDGPFVFVGTTTGSIVHQHKQREVSFAANTSVDRYAGLLLTQSVSSVLTLPTAAGRIGFEYEFWNSAGTTLQISPAAGDAILQLGLVTGEDLIIRTLGTRIKLQAVAANQWAVVELYGAIEPEGFLAPKRTVYQTAAPATRTWVVGDRCINSTPTVGQPKAWTCTVAGTPGTWVSEGVL